MLIFPKTFHTWMGRAIYCTTLLHIMTTAQTSSESDAPFHHRQTSSISAKNCVLSPHRFEAHVKPPMHEHRHMCVMSDATDGGSTYTSAGRPQVFSSAVCEADGRSIWLPCVSSSELQPWGSSPICVSCVNSSSASSSISSFCWACS